MNIVWSNAFIVIGLGLLIVFVLLALLVFFLNGFSWFFTKKEKLQPEMQSAVSEEKTLLTAAEEAAVAMALHLFYQDVHDEESYVITIEEQQSSWNSKIYGLNNLVR